MKKRVIGMVVVGCMAVIAVVYFVQWLGRVELTQLMKENAEALSDGEINPDCPNGCDPKGNGCYCNGWHECLKEHDWHDPDGLPIK